MQQTQVGMCTDICCVLDSALLLGIPVMLPKIPCIVWQQTINDMVITAHPQGASRMQPQRPQRSGQTRKSLSAGCQALSLQRWLSWRSRTCTHRLILNISICMCQANTSKVV